MWKRLAILSVGVLIVAAILVAVYYQQRNAVGQGCDIKYVQPSEPSSASASLACTIYQGQNTEQGHSSLHWWNVLIAWPEGITAWLLLFTLAAIVWQSYATSRAATATEQAVVAADKATKRQLRAYFGIPEGKFCIFADGRVEPRLTFKNCGQTPAYELEVETCGRFESRGDQYPPPRTDPDLHPHRHIVGGGSPYHFTCKTVQSGREKDVLLNDLALGHLAFRLYGKCTYRDAFKDPHFIDFQLFVGGGAIVQYTTDPDKGSLTMLTDSKGNSAD